MPNYWVKVTASPPKKRHDDLKKIIDKYTGYELRDDELYSDLKHGVAYLLINGPDDSVRAKALFEEMRALDVLTVLDLKEAERAFELLESSADTGSAAT